MVDSTANPKQKHGTHPVSTAKNHLKLYVPDKDLELVKLVKAQMKTDGGSLSDWVVERIREWWQAHSPGNPQTHIERYEDPAKPAKHKHQWQLHNRGYGVWFTCQVEGCKEEYVP